MKSKNEGFTLSHASSGEEGLERLAGRNPRAVLLDIGNDAEFDIGDDIATVKPVVIYPLRQFWSPVGMSLELRKVEKWSGVMPTTLITDGDSALVSITPAGARGGAK